MAPGEKKMRIYLLALDDTKRLNKIVRLLDKHNIRYSSIIVVVSDEEKARVIGGIISKYNLQRIRLEDIFLIIASP